MITRASGLIETGRLHCPARSVERLAPQVCGLIVADRLLRHQASATEPEFLVNRVLLQVQGGTREWLPGPFLDARKAARGDQRRKRLGANSRRPARIVLPYPNFHFGIVPNQPYPMRLRERQRT